MQGIGIEVSDFKVLRIRNNYFIDKSLYTKFEIKFLFSEIIDDWFRNKVIGNDLNTILKDLVTL